MWTISLSRVHSPVTMLFIVLVYVRLVVYVLYVVFMIVIPVISVVFNFVSGDLWALMMRCCDSLCHLYLPCILLQYTIVGAI